MKQFECATDDALRQMAKAGGIQEIQLSEAKTNGPYYFRVSIKHSGAEIYLATRRNAATPREFKRIDVAISVAKKIFPLQKRFSVVVK